jgi:hypothetical protein
MIHALHDSLKHLRILQAVYLVTIPLFVYSGEVLGATKTKGLTMIGYFLLALAAFDIWSALSWCRRRLLKACQFLLLRPNDAEAVKQWHSASLVCSQMWNHSPFLAVCCEYGVVERWYKLSRSIPVR